MSPPHTPFTPWTLTEIEQSIPSRFATVVAQCPHHLALKTRGEAWTYAELNERAQAIARAILDARGDALETVALYFEQGASVNAATLGALMAHKIYVPLDPTHPPAALTEILHDAEIPLLLTDAEHFARARALCALTNIPILNVEHHPAILKRLSAIGNRQSQVPIVSSPSDPAHIYYTSGSTGKPKGVVRNHRSLLHTVLSYTNQLQIRSGDRLTLLQSPAFSAVVSSVFSALLNGATLFPIRMPAENPDALAEWLIRERVTIYHSVPALFRRLLREGRVWADMRVVRLEGDAATRRDAELFFEHFAPGAVLANGLGTTETNLVSQYLITHSTVLDANILPVGYAVPGMRVVILDEAGEEIQGQEVGEIGVASRYLASGYWKNPEATAARFLPDPQDGAGRIYRTGDSGRLRADGCLEYLGRRDFRVKVRGQFVEPAVIEDALLSLSGVESAAVVARADRAGENELVAFLVAPSLVRAALRQQLAARLPQSQIPAKFVFLESLPLTENAKVDRRALRTLPLPEETDGLPYVAPQNETEAKLAAIWSEVLGRERVSTHTPFLDLGGDSLRAFQILSRVSDGFDVQLTAREFFSAPTIAAQALLIAKSG